MKISTDELSRQAYKQVKKMIVSKKLEPGQKIIQEKLAHSLGISRTPLRSALQMLEAESLIRSIPRRGVIVRKFSDAEIVEVYDCRIALEGMAARLFTLKASQKDIDGLYGLFEPFENQQAIHQGAYQKADMEFHDTLIKRCGNSFLYQLFQKGNLLVCIHMIGLVRPPNETLEEHLAIISAIGKRDAKQAEELICKHLEKSRELILKKMQGNG